MYANHYKISSTRNGYRLTYPDGINRFISDGQRVTEITPWMKKEEPPSIIWADEMDVDHMRTVSYDWQGVECHGEWKNDCPYPECECARVLAQKEGKA